MKMVFRFGFSVWCLLSNLSKDFDCLSYDFLLAKLNVHEFVNSETENSILKSIATIAFRKKFLSEFGEEKI